VKFGIFSICLSTLFAQLALASQLYTTTITKLQPPSNGQDCVFFELSGVSQADPVVPNNPWFALPRTQTGFEEVYAALLSAKVSGATIQVQTTGGTAGGACTTYAAISWIILQ
jgi:hypothetical protein